MMLRVLDLQRRLLIQLPKTLNNDYEFNHFIEHALACTLEKDFKDVSYGSNLVFGTIKKWSI